MKKLFFFLSFFAAFSAAFSQVPWITYEPVNVTPAPTRSTSTSSNSGYDQSRQRSYSQPRGQSNYQVVNAYFINQRGAFEKVRIKVNVVNNGYFTEVWVRGYYDKEYNMWHEMNTRADEVSNSDPDVIRENFDWSCKGVGYLGKVFF